jgi:hypothetical protein
MRLGVVDLLEDGHMSIFVVEFWFEEGFDEDFFFADGAYLLLHQPVLDAVAVVDVAALKHSDPLHLLNGVITDAASEWGYTYIYFSVPSEQW